MPKHLKDEPFFWPKALLIALIIWSGIFLLFKFVISNDIVQGDSMQPNFFQGERLISLKTAAIHRGDVVILKAPDHSGDYYIKRVVGLPGDTVRSNNDNLYINNKKVPEPYLNLYRNTWYMKHAVPFTANFSLQSLQATDRKHVPKNHYFLLGDNRTVSNDSRSFGFISRPKIQSVVVLRYWPIYTFRFY